MKQIKKQTKPEKSLKERSGYFPKKPLREFKRETPR